MKPLSKQELSDEELDQLQDLLEHIGPSAMNFEQLDGFLAALICGPDLVMPSEYLPKIFGEDYSFKDADEATQAFQLVMRHWNAIVGALAPTIKEPDVYLPVLLHNEDGIAMANDWAIGFMQGVEMRGDSWDVFLDDDKVSGPILPMMMLAHEHDLDPQMRPPAIALDKREELLLSMIAGLTQIYRYFEPYRKAGTWQEPVRRVRPKVGRNDSCPCGSGRKFKQCCAGNDPILH